VSNAAEDDQATVRATSFGLRSPRTADKRERGDAGKALARRGWPCWCAGLPNARRGHWSRLVHDGARELEGNARSVLPSFALVAATGLLWAPCAGPCSASC